MLMHEQLNQLLTDSQNCKGGVVRIEFTAASRLLLKLGRVKSISLNPSNYYSGTALGIR